MVCLLILGFIYSYRSDELFLLSNNGANPNDTSNMHLYDKEVRMETKYLDISLPIKATAFIPSLATFVAFIALIIVYGRVKPTRKNPYVGRVVKVPKTNKPPGMFAIVRMKLMRRKVPPNQDQLAEVNGTFTKAGESTAKGSSTTIDI